MLLALAIALATTVGPGGGVAAGVVRGQVRSETSGAPLALAVVEVLDGVNGPKAVTDSTGGYVLRPVTPGRHVIRATHLDHAPFEVEVLVPPGGDMVVDLSLALRPITLPPVTAWGGNRGVDTTAATPSDLSAASMRLLEASPGVAELGIAQAARAAPGGGGDAGDPADVLYVRGGAADLKLVLLDGAPVYAPFHVGGMLSPFDPEVLGSAKLYLGGAPARYDGGLSYVMDLQTRSGHRDGTRTSGALDMVSGRAGVEGPLLGPTSYLLSVRGVHGLGAEPLMNGRFPYMYADGLGRFDVDLGDDRSIRVTGFWNREAVRLDQAEVDPSAWWGNVAGSARYRGQIAGAMGEITVAFGEFDAMLPVGGAHPMRADGTSRRMRMTADFAEPLGPGQLYWGASYDRLTIQYLGWPLASLDTLLLDSEAGGNALGAYVDGAWQAFAHLRLRAGVRADLFSATPEPRIGPRLSATWLMTPHSALTLAAGRYHQYVRATEAAVASSEANDAPAVKPLTVAQSSHLTLALDQQIVEGLRLGLEGFYKTFEGLPGATPGEDPRARSSGADLWLRGGRGGFNGWVGYSLAWVWSQDPAVDVSELFSGRQLVSAGLAAPIIGRAHLDVRVSYGSGMPFTAVPQPDRPPVVPTTPMVSTPRTDLADATPDQTAINPGPDDPYFRVDAQLARSFAGQYRGVAFEITPYLRVLNALDRRDALFYQYDRTRDNRPQAVAALPVLPIVGFSWRF